MPSPELPFDYFTDAELTALARLLMIILRIDGQTTPEEEKALEHFAERVRRGSLEGGTKRYGGTLALGDAGAVLKPYLERAAELPATKEEFEKAAASIERKQAREIIYGALFDVAAADLIVRSEWDLLKILCDTWQLEEA
jgi:hypothetical protein